MPLLLAQLVVPAVQLETAATVEPEPMVSTAQPALMPLTEQQVLLESMAAQAQLARMAQLVLTVQPAEPVALE